MDHIYTASNSSRKSVREPRGVVWIYVDLTMDPTFWWREAENQKVALEL